MEPRDLAQELICLKEGITLHAHEYMGEWIECPSYTAEMCHRREGIPVERDEWTVCRNCKPPSRLEISGVTP